MNPENFEKPRYTFGGIYRGLVEDNDDPNDTGRIKVRIFGLHDVEKMIIDQIPWAYPALSLYWSGGYNINNDDHITEPPPKDKGQRYNPGNRSQIEKTKDNSTTFNKPNDSKFVEDRMDPVGNACGTGGQFVVPKRGNWVFIFFEGGNHMNPIYFAMAPMARDWNVQKIQRNEEIVQKINQISDFKKDFHPRTVTESSDLETWTNNAVVNADIGLPGLNVQDITDSNSNRDIFCTTTAQGTTMVVDNRFGKERIYLIHKNTIEHTDENGNKLMYVGKSRGIKKQDQKNVPSDNDSDVACNYEIGVEGNHEVYVLGQYKLYAKEGVYIQVDGTAQIDVIGDVGVVSQEGNINAIVKKGDLNVDVSNDGNINIAGNANIKVDGNANVSVKKNLKATVEGTSDLTLKGSIKLTSTSDLNLSIAGDTKLSTPNLNIVTTNLKVSGNADFGGSVKIGQNLDVTRNITVGQYAYIFAGINCGGTLINRGLAELGSPCILHLAAVIPGMAPGTGKSPQIPANPSTPQIATEASKEYTIG